MINELNSAAAAAAASAGRQTSNPIHRVTALSPRVCVCVCVCVCALKAVAQYTVEWSRRGAIKRRKWHSKKRPTGVIGCCNEPE